jgi:ParB-like chromosome segregation protein Spo0J
MEAKKFYNTVPTYGIQIHPDASTVRMMNEEEYAALRDDIAKNGQLVPATMCNGMLLDGRNRLKACEELGIGLWVEQLGDSDTDTVAMVYSLNVTRRHLNTAERAFMGADMANLKHGKHDNRANQYTGKSKVEKSKMDLSTNGRKYTRHEAATVVECSPQDITAARNVRRYAPELEEKAKRNEIHIREAERLAKIKRDEEEKKKQPKQKVTPITPKTKIIAPTVDAASALTASWDDLLACVNISTTVIDEAKSDIMHPQYMVACRLAESRDRITTSMAGLNKPDRKKAMQAVVSVLAHHQEVFEAEVKASLPKYNRELEQRLKKEIEEQKSVTAELKKLAKDGFDKSDFKVIRGVLHPDRKPSDEQRAKAFDLLLKLEPIFLRG